MEHTTLKGYRVITMSNGWIKICEKVVAVRPVRLVMDPRSRWRQTTAVNHFKHRGNCAQGTAGYAQTSAYSLFDLEDAYNKVDVVILARKMSDMGIIDMLIRSVMATLKARTCCMKLGRSQAFRHLSTDVLWRAFVILEKN
jgi:hypothetical protein